MNYTREPRTHTNRDLTNRRLPDRSAHCTSLRKRAQTSRVVLPVLGYTFDCVVDFGFVCIRRHEGSSGGKVSKDAKFSSLIAQIRHLL